MSSAAAPRVSDLVSLYGKASTMVSSHDKGKLFQVALHVFSFLEDEWELLLQQHPDTAVLRTVSIDGTPLKLKWRLGSEVGASGPTRYGVHGSELAVAIGFLRGCTPAGQFFNAVKMLPPMSLSEGKKGWNHVSGLMRLGSSLRQAGHKAIAIEHLVADRALCSCLDGHLRSFHSLVHSNLVEPGVLDAEDASFLNLQNWCVCTGCCNHDAHNSMKWALHRFFSDSNFMKQVWGVMESCRYSMSAVAGAVHSWLNEVLTFPDVHPVNDEVLQQVWISLGIETEITEELVSLGLLFHSGSLIVKVAHAQSQEIIEKVTGMLFHIFRFKKYSDSRWLTVATSARAMVAAALVGFPELINHCRRQGSLSEWYSAGFSNDEGVKAFFGHAGFVGYIGDAFIAVAVQDDRLASMGDELKDEVLGEVVYLMNLPASVFEVIGFRLGLGTHEFRTEVLRSAVVAWTYLHHRVFAELARPPWSLCVGDIKKNLMDLHDLPEAPTEVVSSKIFHLLKGGMAVEQVAAGVALLKEVSWSTTTTEQLHAAAATIHRFRPDVEEEMLKARAFLYSCKPLFGEDALHKREMELERKIHKLESQPKLRSVPARQMFLKELHLAAKGKFLSAGPTDKKQIQAYLMKHHARRFAQLSSQQKQRLSMQGQLLLHEKEHRREMDLDFMRTELEHTKQRFLACPSFFFHSDVHVGFFFFLTPL